MAAAKSSVRRTPEPASPTRELILDAAERLFAARGVDGIAVRDLARELGITPSSLYNHFPSKQALYDAVIERGLSPIVQVVAEAWQPGGLSPERVGATLDALLPHLARHPHVARLLQRALFEEAGSVQALVEPVIDTLYREGSGVVRKAAGRAGWTAAEVPHLTIALFGMIFGYFTNAAALRRLARWGDDPLSPRALAVQRRFLEEAIFRLLGPRGRGAARRRKQRP
ncbi:MAG TPA: TetR/AcrR family transcriptional regulator [Candidatus Binatia bacterium]|nr:TetR/AcrR family transcriptional regulator [Candidatus Binatia bacterium]